MSSTMPRKKTAPSLARIERYWWQEVDGMPRFQTDQLFGYSGHSAELSWEGCRGDAPVCFACGMSTGKGPRVERWLHRGHIVAETYGGTVDLSNMVPLCARCNGAMGQLGDRAEAIAWMEARETWSDYLARIDAATPEHVDRGQVIRDAQVGRDWTPEGFAAHYAEHYTAPPVERPVPVVQAVPDVPCFEPSPPLF